jgi:GT2 family glycosyltransferase
MRFQPKALDASQIEPRPKLADITVVIPTLGRPILEECLWWIVSGSAWPGRLIVVDQGAEGRVAGWIKTLQSMGIGAEYVPSSQRGKAAALNRGIEQVQTRFLVVTDDDCFVNRDWLRSMAGHLREAPDAIITGPAEPEGDEAAVAAVTCQVPGIYRRPRLKYDIYCGSNMGAAVAVIERIGLFDEDPCILAAEDCEWAYRALRAGVPIIYVPDVTVRHYGWRDESERAARYRNYALSHGGFYGKYLRRGDWFIALRMLLHHLRALRRFLRGMITGDRELVLNGHAYLTGLLPGMIIGLRQRRDH